jgi:hypothetical protein
MSNTDRVRNLEEPNLLSLGLGELDLGSNLFLLKPQLPKKHCLLQKGLKNHLALLV